LEGFAFFLEAICLGLYLYGWDRLSSFWHRVAGVGVAVSGLASAVFVTAVNGFMNEPTGYTWHDGHVIDVRPWEAMANAAWGPEALHMSLAAYAAVSVLAVGIHALALRRAPGDALHRHGFRIALGMALVAVPLLIASGDVAAKHIAERQPIKLAAAEGLFETRTEAPMTIGGWPDIPARRMRGAIEIPYGLSILAFNDPHAEVTGLDAVEPASWPPIAVVHLAFQIMVGCGMTMLAFVGWCGFRWWRGRVPPYGDRFVLRVAPWVAPLGLVAIEAGWTVTEVGRQPWIVRGLMRTSEAVTPMPGLWLPCLLFCGLYLVLGLVVFRMLRKHVAAASGRRA
jgi:cytochrome d ubiquinol oxidase subunit I